jgi:phenylalanyl-tRNA synthetase alpha chain
VIAPTPITADQLRHDLAVRDLTDPAAGSHAVQLVLGAVTEALARAWPVVVRPHRGHPVVSIADNYDVLGFSAEAVTRDGRYSRYVDAGHVLRTHTSALVPGALRALAADPHAPDDALLVCPGVVYRRDAIDRLHTGTPHQVDLWRIADSATGPVLGRDDLLEMVDLVVRAALPGVTHRVVPSPHPYTRDGIQIDAEVGGEWVEIGECGVADPAVLARCGLDASRVGGLAMGLGLDRLVMLRKGIDDIRLLRADDPRVVEQLLTLDRYRAVSSCPAIVRDLSVAVAAGIDDETLGDRVRAALGAVADQVEEVAVLSTTPEAELPDAARARLGIRPGQVNVLVRVVLRRLDRALTRAEANDLRDRVFTSIHDGDAVPPP